MNNQTYSSYSNFISDIKNNKIKTVMLKRDYINAIKQNNNKYKMMYIPGKNSYLLKLLTQKKVKIIHSHPKQRGAITAFILSWYPALIKAFLIWFFFLRKIKIKKGENPLFFGQSTAKIFSKNQIKITFKNIAGCNEAKEEIKEIVDFLKNPVKFQKLGGRLPKGILMIGPPGTGKTLLAKAIAGEAKVSFFAISGSDFVEMFVGVGASRVRNMFKMAKKKSPSIIFIDEIDAVGRKRSLNVGGGHDEREQTLNQMLVEMDGFHKNQEIIVIAATNRPDVLDPALLRPGRFDKKIIIDLPNMKERQDIIKIHTQNMPLKKNVNISILAQGTPGFSGADLANLVNETALLTARKNLKKISMQEFEESKDKIILGSQKKSLIMNKTEKEITAYHECGHVIVGLFLPEQDPIYKVTIIPRGKSLGVTYFLPQQDFIYINKKKIEGKICTLYGGRIAEEIIYGTENISIGATHDIKTATSIAKKMVTQWGLSHKIGPIFYKNKNNLFLPKKDKYFSEYTAKIIDKEIKKIIIRNYKRAKNILLCNLDILYHMKKKLIKYETLNKQQIQDIIKKKNKRLL